jgi:hypothetical protein
VKLCIYGFKLFAIKYLLTRQFAPFPSAFLPFFIVNEAPAQPFSIDLR